MLDAFLALLLFVVLTTGAGLFIAFVLALALMCWMVLLLGLTCEWFAKLWRRVWTST